MGLFKKTNAKEKKAYQNLHEKTEELRKQNEKWQQDFDKLIDYRNKGDREEKNNNYEQAINFYLKSIEFGENETNLNINNYAHDIQRIIILYSKTNQTDKLKNFLVEKIKKHHDFSDVKDWEIRLSKLENKGNQDLETITPDDIVLPNASKPSIGEKINKLKTKMPDFNFYYDLAPEQDTMTYNHRVPIKYFRKLKEYRDEFDQIKKSAKLYESKGDYKAAIEEYYKLIAEDYEGPEPYERLMIIFAKLKWHDKEKDIIEKAINFFYGLKERQLEYISKLAAKYGMTEKVNDYINNDKKIFYYGGAFELYNPQTSRINKWNKRLEKIINKT